MVSTAPSRHLLIPFAGRRSPGCEAALAQLDLPNLESLLGRLALADDDTQDDSTMSPPHERALARALGMSADDGRIAWAAREAQNSGLSRAGSGEPWAVVTLCHWEVAIDEVVMDDPADIAIDAAESQALLEAARPFFQEDGISLRPSAVPGRWLARGEVFRTLATASPDRAAGQPISAWAPLSDALKPVRKLQNEMQMLLYTQRVNDERTARGAQPINSFWLSGTGVLPKDVALAKSAEPAITTALRRAALQDDGAGWAAAWKALDAGPIAELLAASTAGSDVVLTLCGDRSARRFTARQRSASQWLKGLFNRTSARTVLAAL